MNSTLATKPGEQSLPPMGFLLLAALSLFWGLNWPGMKIILSELPVWWFRASCVLVGGLGLLTISAASGNRVIFRRRELPALALCALFNVCGWHLFSGYGVSLMPAGRAAIIAFTMPVWAALFSSLLLGERFSAGKAVGLLLGVSGLAVLIGPDLVVVQQAPLGAIFMLGAAVSWGFGTILFKRGIWSIPVASHIGWQLLLSALPITLGAALLEPFPDLTQISQKAVFALVYVYSFPMIFCQWAYFKAVHLYPASSAAVGTLLVPVIGVYSSSLLLSEPVGWPELAALLLICAALACVLVLPSLRRGASTA
jgi:drug/metabolite transporter (DMT)-like permease